MSTSSRTKRRKPAYHHGDLPAAVLAAAGEILEKQGLDGLKMRAVARRTGVSHHAPYRHYPDRESLLAALAAEGYAELGRRQQAARAHGGLRAMGEAYVRFALDQPQRFRLMFGGQVAIGRHPVLREVATRAYEGLASALAAEVPQAHAARDASLAAWALVHGLALLLLDERIAAAARGARDRESLVRAVLGSVRFAAGPAQSA